MSSSCLSTETQTNPHRYLGAFMKGGGTQGDHLNKKKYADAALDAAASFVDTLQAVTKSGKMMRRMPLIV
jgi:hypothetical protein